MKRFNALLPLVLLLFVFSIASCTGDGGDSDSSGDAADNEALSDDDTDDDPEFTAVNMTSATSPAERLAVHACQGLYNRESGGSVYTIAGDKDRKWLEELDLTPTATVSDTEFLATCVAEFPACVRYSYDGQQKLLPNILTVGTVLGAVPIAEEMSATCDDAVFDAVIEFAELDTAYLATKFVYEHFVDETAGLAMLNPGYDSGDTRWWWDPAFDRDMSTALVDYVFSQKLFTIFMINGCVPLHPEHTLMNQIAANNPWPRPIGVYGYADYWLVFGGYLFEAQTKCAEARNMGAIPTKTSNLSFFSTRSEPIVEPGELVQNEPEEIAYDPNDTYVAFIIGDGDNVSYMMDARGNWLRQRLEDCARAENSCEPITWSISPHLPHLAPDVLRWYYDMSYVTGKDYFALPPSGHLYAYPASLAEPVQDQFVAATERDAKILDTDGTVHWEWFTTWNKAETEFMPKYARANGAIRGIFPVNVPYMFPTFTGWGLDEYFRVISGADGGRSVLFKPQEWRGVDDSGSIFTKDFFLSPANMAGKIASYPRGTVAYMYMTSDGGLNLENSFMALVQLLPDHVHLVSAGTAARLALEAAGE